MPQSHEMIAQIVEKLGMPILASVSEVERQKQAMGRVQGTPSDESQARLIAELLGKSTELGLMLFRSFDITEPTESRADAARLGMTALSGSVIANLYGMTGRIPGDPELQRLEKVVQSVVAFSENFESGHDAAQALGAADGEKTPALPALEYMAVHYASALIPLVNAVAAFPFGRQEELLMKEIVSRLMGVAKGFCERLYPDANAEQRKAVEVSIMKVAANTYAQCHFAEMTQLMSAGDQQKMMAQNISMDGVWAAFDKRFAMLEVIISSLMGSTATAAQSSAPVQPQAQVQPQPQPQQAPVAVVDVTAPPAPPAEAVAAPVVDVTAPPAAVPAIDVTAPPAAAQVPPVHSTPPVAPPATPPSTSPAADDNPAEAASSSDPMAFFSTPPAATEES
tara:strand:- start:334045 stop:335229 length:1185 start_codon:yes stop_codon:yes gene_type:complete